MGTRNPSFANNGAPTEASLLGNYNNAIAKNNTYHYGGAGVEQDTAALRNAQDALNRFRSTQASSNASAAPAVDPAKSRQQILDNTQGRGDAVMNDAMTNAALGRLQGVATGQDAPFTQTVQNQMLAKQAGMNASAESSQAQQLRQQAAGLGGSIADPSYQAKMRELSAQTQSANTSAQGDISTNAQLQNFGARQTANNSLMSGRMAQLGMGNSQYNQAAQFLQNDISAGQHVSGTTQPMYNFYGAGAGTGMRYQPPAVQGYPSNQPGAATPAGPTADPADSGPIINAAGGVGDQQYGPPSPLNVNVHNAAGGFGDQPYGPPVPDNNYLYRFGPPGMRPIGPDDTAFSY